MMRRSPSVGVAKRSVAAMGRGRGFRGRVGISIRPILRRGKRNASVFTGRGAHPSTMHAILATVGTDGDVFPYVGLGVRLRARGPQVTLAPPEPHRDLAADRGIGFRPLVTADEAGRMLADPDLWHPLRSGRMMAKWGAGLLPRHYEQLAALAAGPGSVLVANPGV